MTNNVDRNIPMIAFRRGTFENLIYRMSLGEWIESSELSSVLRKNVGQPFPPEFVELICRRLEGNDPKPQGRPPLSPWESAIRSIAPFYYRKYYDWLKRRKRSIGLAGWRRIRDADWWQGAPSERAARMVQKKLFPTIGSWRHVRDICKSD